MADDVDVRRFVPTWLTLGELRKRGGRYEGVVREVRANRTRNRYRFEDGKPVYEEQPLVVFADGAQWIPNVGALRTLIERLGPESDRWVGQRFVVYANAVERTDKATGEVRTRHERAVTVVAPRPVVNVLTEAPATERADYDDSDEALAEAGQTPARTNGKAAVMTAEEIPWSGSR